MLKGMIRFMVFVACASLAWHASADQTRPSETAADDVPQQQDSDAQAPPEINNPVKMDEPMQGGMMKKGMMKGDVKESAAKKNKEMEKMLKKEEESMPPMPAQTPKM
jgi:hypothetical protein